MLIRKVGPRVLLSAITILWGAVMLGMGFVTDWTQLLACRFLLGLLESGELPTCLSFSQLPLTIADDRLDVFCSVYTGFFPGCESFSTFDLLQIDSDDASACLPRARCIFNLMLVYTTRATEANVVLLPHIDGKRRIFRIATSLFTISDLFSSSRRLFLGSRTSSVTAFHSSKVAMD